MEIVYKDFNILSEDQVRNLYEKAGWTAYTKNIKKLLFGIQNSSFVCSAWDNKQLIGLIRVMSDDYTVCYIQDLLVLPDYQSQGIGQTLIQKVLSHYKNVRQVILTSDENGPLGFYEKMGFQSVDHYDCKTYMMIRNQD
jgi:ribosomal protein S18 acetylase RimI-like enzyme